MNAIFLKLQRLAREVQAIKAPLPRLIELAYRGESPDRACIAHLLRRESAQATLAQEYETLLYRHTTGQFVLICTALPDNPKDAQQLTTRRLINSRDSCSFCNLNEGSFATLELVTATSPVGTPIQGEKVHPRCSLYWTRLKLIAESAPIKIRDAAPTKASLL